MDNVKDTHWSFELQEKALAEGWGIFNWGDVPDHDIQRVDDPSSLGPFDETAEPLFDNDSEAIAHVVRKAREGSQLHILALALARKTTIHVTRAMLANGSI